MNDMDDNDNHDINNDNQHYDNSHVDVDNVLSPIYNNYNNINEIDKNVDVNDFNENQIRNIATLQQ